MKIKNILIAVTAGLFALASCETTDLDLVDNPNALNPSQADATFFLNNVQISFAGWVQGFANRGAALSRINQMSGRNYAQVYSPSNFDGSWTSAYQGMMEDIRLMNLLADESGLTIHKAMGQTMQAYIMVTLVDFFGDVPYSEALKGSEGNLAPTADSGDAIYNAALALLDEAVAGFTAGGPTPSNDFYYGGSASKWAKAANSIKKKIYYTTGNTSGFNGVTDYIDEESEDFQFQWGTNEVNPDSRHPWYRSSYTSTGGGTYMSNWYMNLMLNGHGGKDPRMAYYFYRQTDGVPGIDIDPNEEVLECSLYVAPTHYQATNEVYCGVGNGYWGRDHGNSDGIPPDGFLRTLHGVYPAGGAYDDGSYESKVNGDGNGGDGITPIMLSSWMDFMDGFLNASDAAAMLESGATKSINKADSLGGPKLDSDTVDTYVAAMLADYNAADAAGKADIFAQQFWIAQWGGGIDAYNTYRKTGLPSNVQPNLEPSPGDFPLIMYYPSNYANTNSNVTQRTSLTERVFWNAGGPSNLK
jgi:hypothetical protein